MSVKDAQECLGAASFLIPLISDHSSRSPHPHPSLLPSREKGSEPSLETTGGGELLDPIWPCLASFTPSGEAGNGATVASFGTPLTRTRWASRPWLWPWLASSGVVRSGITFNSVAFGCISFHSLSSTRTSLCPGRVAIHAFLRKVPVFGHFGRYSTSGAHGFSGVAKSGGPPIPWPDLARFTPRDLRSKPGMRGSRLHGNDGGVAKSGKTFNSVAFGCISLHFLVRTLTLTWIPAFAGMTGAFA